MNENISIRPFEDDDIDAMIDLFRRSVHEIANADYSKEQLEVWAPNKIDSKAWHKNFSSHPTFIAVRNQQLVGFSDLLPNGHLDMMYVCPDAQNLGVAYALYQQVELQAIQQENTQITTHASLTARGFFERQGFQVKMQQQVERKGIILANFSMFKNI